MINAPAAAQEPPVFGKHGCTYSAELAWIDDSDESRETGKSSLHMAFRSAGGAAAFVQNRLGCKIKAVAAETNQAEAETHVVAKASAQSLRLYYQGGNIAAAGCQPMLEDVNPEVFVCRSNDESLTLGVGSADGARSMYDIVFGKVTPQL